MTFLHHVFHQYSCKLAFAECPLREQNESLFLRSAVTIEKGRLISNQGVSDLSVLLNSTRLSAWESTN
jgi:hypothetical protein